MKRKSRGIKLIRNVLLGVPLLCILVVAVSGLSNIGLPIQSSSPEKLSDAQKALLSEALRLQSTFGGKVWPGWEENLLPVIVHNEAYAFLVGFDGQPSPGWQRMVGDSVRGAAWELVPGEVFRGGGYYRQALSKDGPTPENFTMLIGDTWVSTLYTREYSRIALFSDFSRQTPFPVNKILPYRLIWKVLLGSSETYIGALVHEAFHAYQATVVLDRLDAAEESVAADGDYPWDDTDLTDAWQTEMDLLASAVRSETEVETRSLACQFLNHRETRRRDFGLTAPMVGMEREREWLEGQAKYVELTVLRLAGEASGGTLSEGISSDPDFSAYGNAVDYYWQQVGEVQRLSNRSGDTRFYYTGFAQAAILDRLNSGWQGRAFAPGVYLEDLLQEVCDNSAAR